jgi:hypothetical protein
MRPQQCGLFFVCMRSGCRNNAIGATQEYTKYKKHINIYRSANSGLPRSATCLWHLRKGKAPGRETKGVTCMWPGYRELPRNISS